MSLSLTPRTARWLLRPWPLLLPLLLAPACGQKGDLHLPEPPPQEQAAPAAAVGVARPDTP